MLGPRLGKLEGLGVAPGTGDVVGLDVEGLRVGSELGLLVGPEVLGLRDGLPVVVVGPLEGTADGLFVVGLRVGPVVLGLLLGFPVVVVGLLEGTADGLPVVGLRVGCAVLGLLLGFPVVVVGLLVGCLEGLKVLGLCDGLEVFGRKEGPVVAVGLREGLDEGLFVEGLREGPTVIVHEIGQYVGCIDGKAVVGFLEDVTEFGARLGREVGINVGPRVGGAVVTLRAQEAPQQYRLNPPVVSEQNTAGLAWAKRLMQAESLYPCTCLLTQLFELIHALPDLVHDPENEWHP